MAVPEKVIDLSLQQSVWIMHGILPPETPDIEPLPWGWAAVTFGCDHERYPRHRCESFRYNVLVREFMVAWG